MRRGLLSVAGVVLLALPAGAWAGRAQTSECPRELCAGIAPDGSRVVFSFGEELTPKAGRSQVYEWTARGLRALIPVPPGASAAIPGSFVGESADLQHLFVETSFALVPEDLDGGAYDVYDFSGGTASLISTGPLDGNNASPFMSFMGASPDGARAFFDAFSPLTSDDLDNCPDLYQRYAGQTTLVAPEPNPPPPPPLCNSVAFGGVSADGSHLFFSSADDLEPADERGEDIYQQVGSTFTRLTTYPEPEGSCVDLVRFVDASSDGGTVLFTTNSPVTAEDTDSAFDVYKRRPDGTFVLISHGSDGGSGQCGFGGDRAIALSADGGTAIFETTARLSPADTDSSNDLYSADGSGAISLVSTGPTDPNVDERSVVFPDWVAGVSDDAAHVAFETRQGLVAADKDNSTDVYVRANGRTELVSTGPLDRDAKSRAELLGISADGTTVVFASTEALTRRDGDRGRDIYRWRNGPHEARTALLSAETIPPRMRISRRARLLASGAIKVGLACPKLETHGPCAGKVRLTRGRAGGTIGIAPFRIGIGRTRRIEVPLKDSSRPLTPLFVHVRGGDQVGSRSTIVHRIAFVRPGR
jgi:hypothetical protein